MLDLGNITSTSSTQCQQLLFMFGLQFHIAREEGMPQFMGLTKQSLIVQYMHRHYRCTKMLTYCNGVEPLPAQCDGEYHLTLVEHLQIPNC